MKQYLYDNQKKHYTFDFSKKRVKENGSVMKSIKLHCVAFVIALPCILALSEGEPVVNLIGIAYILFLFRLSSTKIGKRFIRRYYKEILWLESLL